MKGYKVSAISRSDCEEYILKIHYAKRWPSISFAFGLFLDNELVGIISYGTPASAPLRKGIVSEQFRGDILELNRLCLLRNLPNEASLLVGRSLKLLTNKIVISFADTSQGHLGTVYQACNFSYVGLSAKRTDWKVKGKEHLHGQTVADEFRGQPNRAQLMRDKYGSDFYLHPRPRKHRYVYLTGDKRWKKQASAALKYPISDYPKQQEQQPMQAPKTLEELREAIQTPFRLYELASIHKWSADDKKNIGEWIRQLVTKGHAVRFNQEWPTNKQDSRKKTILMKPQMGQTVIATSALKAAVENDTAIEFGYRPYKLVIKDSPLRKGGYLYCTHKRVNPDEHTAKIWRVLGQSVLLSAFTQADDSQLFFYNEETSQYLMRTTLTKKQVEVWNTEKVNPGVTAAPEPALDTPPPAPAVDPVAQGVRTGCIQCNEVSFMTDADKITVGEAIRFMCEGCRAERT